MPVIPSSPAYDWIGRVNRLSSKLAQIRRDSNRSKLIEDWAGTEFAKSVLRIEAGLSYARALSASDGESGFKDTSQEANIRSALNIVQNLARDGNQLCHLTPETLLQIEAELRPEQIATEAGGQSDTEEGRAGLRLALEAACYWWTADSFLELHPVEQAAVVHLRLIDLNTFGDITIPVSLVACSLFVMRANLPPIIVAEPVESSYRRALSEAGRMNTQPMVELFAQSAELSLTQITRLAGGK